MPQHSDNGENSAASSAHNSVPARENSVGENKQQPIQSVNTRSRTRSALLNAASSDGQTQIPDTWRLDKETEEAQKKKDGNDQEQSCEATSIGSGD